MELPLIPAFVISIWSMLIVVLVFPAIYRIPYITHEALIRLIVAGLIWLAVGFFVYGVLYLYFMSYIPDIEIRQKSVRFAFMFLEAIATAWLLAIILKKNGKK